MLPTTNTNAFSGSRPLWLPLAAQACEALHEYYKDLQATGYEDINDSGLPRLTLSDDMASSRTTETADANGDDTDQQSHVHIDPQRLLLVLRLVASFETLEQLRSHLLPRSVLIIRGIPPESLHGLKSCLDIALLPDGFTVSLNRDSLYSDQKMALLLPNTRGRDITDHHLGEMLEVLDRSLKTTIPLWICWPKDQDLRDPLHADFCHQIELAAIDADIVLALLHQTHATQTELDENAIRAVLPSDEMLKTLTTSQILLALRAPTAEQVAQRLSKMLAKIQIRTPEETAPRPLIGHGVAYDTARHLIADLQLWSAGEVAWDEIPHSLLLYGAPGTGKSYLARAMGKSADATFIASSCAEWQAAGHLGDMLREMRRSFKSARDHAPSLLFIDELDSLGSRADHGSQNSNYRRNVINAFLECMDQIIRHEGVMVVGACNHPDTLDPAILRAGRMDLKTEVPPPSLAMRLEILRSKLGTTIAAEDLADIARTSAGLTAADIDANIRSARSAARHSGYTLTADRLRDHFSACLPEMDATHLRRVAIHECGHAIVATHVGATVTDIVLTPDGGLTSQRSAARIGLQEDFEASLAIHMAGRAAERLVFGTISGGAGGSAGCDLAQATVAAAALDFEFGLGSLGPVWQGRRDPRELNPNDLSRIRKRLETAEATAGQILSSHHQLLEEMADALVSAREFDHATSNRWLATVAGQSSCAAQS